MKSSFSSFIQSGYFQHHRGCLLPPNWGMFPHDPSTERLARYAKREARDFRPSFITSPSEDPHQVPDAKLLRVVGKTLDCVPRVSIGLVTRRFAKKSIAPFLLTWPGEHYTLLAAMMMALRPKHVVEIGTAQGASALIMKRHLPQSSTVVTYDIIPWKDMPECGLKTEDFGENFSQHTTDVSTKEGQKAERSIFEQADFIFVDAEKDYDMEAKFVRYFDSLRFKTPPIIVFDDIRLTQMVEIWREISHPKLDISGLGHWSGTGIVHWI